MDRRVKVGTVPALSILVLVRTTPINYPNY